MSSKTIIYGGMFVGSALGGLVPTLWGASVLDVSSVLFSAIGGFLGIYVGYKLANGAI